MGTNYYWVEKKDTCPMCGRGTEVERLHVGKSSCGWCFSLHVNHDFNENAPHSLQDWLQRFQKPGSYIENEYGEPVPPDEMEAVITKRQGAGKDKKWWMGYASPEDWYRQNHAEPGPNNLARHRILAGHCIAHGEGTFDLIVGDFS